MCARLHSRKLPTYVYYVALSNDSWQTPPDATALPMASSHHFTHLRQVSARLMPPLRCCAVPLLPHISRVIKIMYMSIFCDPSKCPLFFRPDLYRVEVRLERLVVTPSLSPSHSPTPPPSRWPALITLSTPSPCFSSFGAACVKLCCLPPPSLVRNIRFRVSSMSDICRKWYIYIYIIPISKPKDAKWRGRTLLLSVHKSSNVNIFIAIQAARHTRTIFPSVRSFVRTKITHCFLQYTWYLVLPLVSSTTTAHINYKLSLRC